MEPINENDRFREIERIINSIAKFRHENPEFMDWSHNQEEEYSYHYVEYITQDVSSIHIGYFSIHLN